MKKILGLCLIVVLFCSCVKSNRAIVRAQHIEEGVSQPSTIEEIKNAISKYQTRINDIQIAAGQVGIWYKLLGIKFLDKKMYGEAMKAFQSALEYYPANQNLYYYVGVCAAHMANASLDFNATGNSAQKFNYLKLSENAFLQAIDLEPRYFRALYSLGVLYVFNLDECEKAIPLLERAITVETKNVDAMFVLARAYYVCSEFESAISIYEKIISTTKNEKKRAEAEANKKLVLETSYNYGG